QLFGGLARDYRITLVAGSIVLPEPRVELGRLEVGHGPLYNVSLVFDQAGNLLGQPQRQRLRAGDLSTAPADSLQVLDTPAGRLAVLPGNEASLPSALTAADEEPIELLALPGFLGEAADTASLGQHLQNLGIHAGLIVQPRGRLWEFAGQPRAQAFMDGRVIAGPGRHGAQLVSLWL